MKIIIGALVVLFVGYVFLWKLPANGWHRETGRGEHVGYVTAAEKVGIFFKTNRAYIKTDTQSSQENAYCVADESTYEKLRLLAENKTHIKVRYVDYIIKGFKHCDHEGEVILDVSPLP